MVIFKDVLDRVSECADPLCRKAKKPIRGEVLSFFDCRKFKEMMKETGEDISEDLAIFYKNNIAPNASKEELGKIKAIYLTLFTSPAEGLKQYGRFVPPLAKVKTSDLARSIGSKDTVGGGILPALRLLHPIWQEKDENKHLLGRVLYIIVAAQYKRSLDRFQKLAEYAGLEGAIGGDVSDAVKKMANFGERLDTQPQLFKLK